ncbi:aminotransferase class III-fold pyridoxal phosphate-dependent enzyme [Pseudomonas guariconensis]|uniref:D-phenylglycine aminotransferase n=1 Tax=Stutzerimonas stutzeri TaxID=316 RepID=Q6VY99_STUST|nr:D-phenylglycine aminotransferase [Stutzerimonas stutzeri]6DVS_A Chain A, D-phenylglycine aminotransferase [Stutzerimonas stutzeri]
MSILNDYKRKTEGSVFWAQRARSVMPDGVTADTRVFDPHGLFISDAQGVHKTDVDGNVYLDFFGGHGALVLGHGHPRVNAAIAEALSHGVQYAASHPLEVRWAERIVAAFPSIRKLRFTGSGTETTLLALRVARAFTGRRMILRIATHYHGWHDFSASGYNSHFDGQPAPGVLPEIAKNTLLIRPDDIEGMREVFAQHGSDIAAFIAEPVGSHFGVTPVSDSFLREGAELARQYGALFILDEVISGFRVGNHGMQALLDVQPDLTCLAKASAGGLPGGILGGREDVMGVLSRGSDRKVLHQGTFTGNPITAAAAIAAIDTILEDDVCAKINDLGQFAREAMNHLFARKGLNWLAYGRFSGFHLMPGLPPNTTDTGSITRAEVARPDVKMIAAMRMALILEGVDIGGRGSVFLSAQHEREHVEHLVTTFDRVLDRLADENLLSWQPTNLSGNQS